MKPFRGLLALLLLTAVVTLGVVGIPVYLIRPFSPQTETQVVVAYHLRTWSPWVAPVGALAAVGLALWLFKRHARWPVLAPAALIAALCLGAAWLSWQNHFEWMFSPLPSADYARARDVAFVDDADMVTAVERNGDAVAYPVRQMAYHHLVNDEVGGVPVVSTY
jgi:hypothetical protein